MSRFQVSLLSAEMERSDFDCGSEPLNRYLREQATQDMRRRIAACFVAQESAQGSEDARIAGYYTLASASVLLSALPPATAKKLPRYPTVPAIRMGRLAVDQRSKGLGLGAALLADALSRALNSEIAAYALIVDAKDDVAAEFYRHHGFIALPDAALSFFLPLETARAAMMK